MSGVGGREWRLVVPVKLGPAAKTRLTRSDVDRIALARAFALDTLAAAAACLGPDRVYAVAGSPEARPALDELGVLVVMDPGGGLNPAVSAGVRAARADLPTDVSADPSSGLEGAVAVLLGDLPALTPADLGRGLAACAAYERAFVPDHTGTGTVLLTAAPTAPLRPLFGEGSAARHRADGCVRIALDLPGLRTDVDDGASLSTALRLGVGPATSALVAGLI